MKKKILFTINYINNGGPSKILLNLIRGLNRNKFEISVLTIIDQNDATIINNLKKNNINVVQMSMKKNILSMLKNWSKVINKVNELNPDIIHTHGIVTSVILASSKIKFYKITTIHNNIYEDYKNTYGFFMGKIIAFVHLKKLKKFNKIVCCSESSFNIIKDKFKQATYIRNGISTNCKQSKLLRKQIRKELNIGENDIVYIYSGVLTNRKNVLNLYKYFEKNLNKNEYLIIVGNGPLLDELKLKKCNNIKLLGYKSNVTDYYIASDIYTSFSKTEGFSISIIEALENGLLLLLSNISSHKECFGIDKKIYLGEMFDEETFKEKKEKAAKKVRNFDKNSIIEFQRKHLSMASMVNEYMKLYEKSGEEND